MAEELVLYQLEKPIASIVLNRPEVHNALNREAMEQLQNAIQRALADKDVRAVIFTGAGEQTFCSGGDLKYFAQLTTRESGLEMSRFMQGILQLIWEAPKPFIAAINGNAWGGGCEILLACHYRIAADHASFSFRQLANGILTGWGGGVRLFQLLGRSRALHLLLTAETFSAEQARAFGFVDEVVPRQEVRSRAWALAQQIAAQSPTAVAALLEVLRYFDRGEWETARLVETNRFADLWVEKPFRQFLQKFLQTNTAKKAGDSL